MNRKKAAMEAETKACNLNGNGIGFNAKQKTPVRSSVEPPSQIGSFFKRILQQVRSTPKQPTHSAIKAAAETNREMNGGKQRKEIGPGGAQNHYAAEASSSTAAQISRWNSEAFDESRVQGVENELLVLQKMLGKSDGDNGFKAIGIVGVGGVGKSTVSQALLRNPQVKSEFVPRIWVAMSGEFTEDEDPKKALVKRILISLGAYTNFLAGQTLGGLLYALRLQLRGKRYLIVLDGVEETQNEEAAWLADLNSSENQSEKLSYGFPKGHGGSVIVTSRSERVAKAMVGEGNLHCLVGQKDPESFWEIFRQEIKIPDTDFVGNPSNLKELKAELLNKCDGLPLAAKMMGQITLKKIPLIEDLRSIHGGT